jgi:hypothetical protein
MGAIEVRIAGRGSVRDGNAEADAGQAAHCDLCGKDADIVVSTTVGGTAPFACKDCLRGRLEAMTLAAWLLREAGDAKLPWGKVSG